MRANVRRVVDCFRRRRGCAGDSRGTIHTDGETIFSYHAPILTRGPDETLYAMSPSQWFRSQTSNRQLRSLHTAFGKQLHCVEHERDLALVIDRRGIPDRVPCMPIETSYRQWWSAHGGGARFPGWGRSRTELEARVQGLLAPWVQLARTAQVRKITGQHGDYEAIQAKLVALDLQMERLTDPDTLRNVRETSAILQERLVELDRLQVPIAPIAPTTPAEQELVREFYGARPRRRRRRRR